MSQFKVGDRVRHIGVCNEYPRILSTVCIGDVGTVTGFNELGNVVVEWDKIPGSGNLLEKVGNRPQYLELVTPVLHFSEANGGGRPGTKPTNPKDRAATNRLDLSLFPDSALAYGALGMTEGDCKYGGYNYRVAGVQVSTYMAAFERHRMKFYAGEWADQKTKIPHLASMLSCIAIVIDGFAQGNVVDDRPPKQDMTALLADFEKTVEELHKLFPEGPARYKDLKQ